MDQLIRKGNGNNKIEGLNIGINGDYINKVCGYILSAVVFTKIPSWGFWQFFTLVPMQSCIQRVSSLKHVIKSTKKRYKCSVSLR